MRFVISYKKKVDVLYIHDSTFNTVKISRPILPEKIYKVKLEAESYGGINRPVEVFRDGSVYDGNHRVAYARETGSCIDIYIR